MKCDNVTTYDSYHWNWSANSVCDDAIFITSCVCEAISDEIRWPNPQERKRLERILRHFPGCIGFIDGTLVEIQRPWHNPNHAKWFNGRKKMYCMNNIVVVDHDGLFIHVDPGYPGSYHDENIFRHSHLYGQWRDFFTQNDCVHKYLFGDPGYSGEDMFIMRRLGIREFLEDADTGSIRAYNKMHVGYRVRVEWGIGGLKHKWRRLMKHYDATMLKYDDFFTSCCLMTNFIHRGRMNDSEEIIGGCNNDVDAHGWDGDY